VSFEPPELDPQAQSANAANKAPTERRDEDVVMTVDPTESDAPRTLASHRGRHIDASGAHLYALWRQVRGALNSNPIATVHDPYSETLSQTGTCETFPGYPIDAETAPSRKSIRPLAVNF
jgi:hypothetical protein